MTEKGAWFGGTLVLTILDCCLEIVELVEFIGAHSSFGRALEPFNVDGKGIKQFLEVRGRVETVC